MHILFAGLLWALAANAQQTRFDVDKGTKEYAYSYAWTDDADQRQEVSFKLPAKVVESELATNNGIDRKEWHAFAAQAARDYVSNLPENVKISVESSESGVDMSGSGPDADKLQQHMENAARLQGEAAEKFLVDRFFRRVDQTTVAFDHGRLTVHYADAVKPIARALDGKTKGPREFADRAIQFVQSLPYEKRQRADAGYRRPYQLIHKNKGDCDSKAVLFLSLIRAKFPDVPLGFAYVPNHALGVLGLPMRSGDVAVTAGGVKWILAESVGPAIHPIGEVSKQTDKYMKTIELRPVVD